MVLKTLENSGIEDIVEALNSAFSDYIIPLRNDVPGLRRKMSSENIDLTISPGAFVEGRLVGLILHGTGTVNGSKVFYNAATGVIPEFRGQKLTQRLYEAILPALKSQQFQAGYLEVIESNVPALRNYEKVGYKINRELWCFKRSHPGGTTKDPSISVLDRVSWEECRTCWDWTPTWQNSTATIDALAGNLEKIGIVDAGRLSGYAVFDPQKGRILQIAVAKEKRRQGLGSRLLSAIAAYGHKELSIINVDGDSTATHHFLDSNGFKPFLKQYEMKWDLP